MRVDTNQLSVKFCGLKFKKLTLLFDSLNVSKEYKDERKFKYTLHSYGNQLFCKFKMKENIKSSGIYLFVFENEVKYVGECANLYNRINNGYGNISPRNCYVGGQSTNCKINALINAYKGKKLDIHLYFCETNISSSDRKIIESKLISLLGTVANGFNNKK